MLRCFGSIILISLVCSGCNLVPERKTQSITSTLHGKPELIEENDPYVQPWLREASKDGGCSIYLEQAKVRHPLGLPYGWGSPTARYLPTYVVVTDGQGRRFEAPPNCMFADLANINSIKVSNFKPNYVIEITGGAESFNYVAKIYIESMHYTKRIVEVHQSGTRRTITTVVSGEAFWFNDY